MEKLLHLTLLSLFLTGLTAYAQVQIGGDIDGETAGDESGRRVSLSADGNVLAIGAPVNDGINGINSDNSGHVRVYKKVEDAQSPGSFQWEQIGGDIDGEREGDFSGISVSLSANGSVLAIGATGNDGKNNANSGSGHVRVYERDASDNWVQLGGDIDGEREGDRSGRSVSLSSDGSVLAIGAPRNKGINGENSGHVRVYGNNGGTWEQIGDAIDGEREGDFSGISVSLSADGNVLAIGASVNDGINGINSDNSGHVRVYENNGGTWEQIGEDIDGEKGGDRSGVSVSLSSDGCVLAIGAPWNNENGDRSGHVRVYKKVEDALSLSGIKWEQIGDDIDGETAGDESGFSVSLSSDGSVLAIGAPHNDENDDRSGHVRVYKKVEDAASPGDFTWVQLGDDIDGDAEYDELGQSVSLSSDGSMLAIGAPGNGLNRDFPGQTRVYHVGASGVSIQGAPAAVHTTDPFKVTFTFDRGVTGFNKEDIVVTHATVDNFMPVDASTSTYTATITPDISTCGNITMNVAAGSALDVDSNLPNFAAREVIVEVMDDVPPDAKAKNITLALGANGQVIINADQIDDGSTDNCGVDNMFIGSNQVISSEGTFDVELIVEDVNGNRANAYAKVTVEAPPTVSIDNAPSDVEDLEPFTVNITFDKEVTGFESGDIEVTNATVNNLTGSGSTYVATLVPTSLCDGITIAVPANVAESTTTGFPNLAAQQLSVGTGDTIAPTMTCPANVVAHTSDNGTDDCTTTVDLGSPVAEDNCSVAAVVAQVNGAEIDPGTYAFGIGTTTVTWIVSDGSGNTASCEQIVTVEATGNCTPEPRPLVDFKRGFSPNGDGIGDTFVIEGLEAYRNNVVRIYDLGQRLLFSAHYGGPGDAWDGTDERGLVPVGNYVCVVDYNEPGLGHEAKMIYVNY